MWPVVLRTCQKLVEADADAEDAAQAALIRLFAQASDYERGRSVRAWACALAYWECRTANQRRRRERTRGLDEVAVFASNDESPEAAAQRAELMQAVAEAIHSMPEEQQSAVNAALRGEIDATAPAATVRKRRQRAMQYLRSLFAGGGAKLDGGRDE